MENFENNVVYSSGHREIAGIDTGEIFTDKEIRKAYPDIYYQYIAPPVDDGGDRLIKIEVAAKTAGAKARAKAAASAQAEPRPEPLELSPEEEQWWRDNRPYLFYDNLSATEVYWKKWDYLVRKVGDYAKRKRRNWGADYICNDIAFAWQMLDEISELLGLELSNEIIRGKINDDLKNPKVRQKYKRVIERCVKQGEIVSVFTLHYRVHGNR